MEVTEVRVKLASDPANKLIAFVSITLGGEIVVRDVKVIRGSSGPWVAFPSRKLADRCGKCGTKNHLLARWCNWCGAKLKDGRAPKDHDGRLRLYADIVHPISSRSRDWLQKVVLEAVEKELARSKEPGYKPRPYSDTDDEYVAEGLGPYGAVDPPPAAKKDPPDDDLDAGIFS